MKNLEELHAAYPGAADAVEICEYLDQHTWDEYRTIAQKQGVLKVPKTELPTVLSDFLKNRMQRALERTGETATLGDAVKHYAELAATGGHHGTAADKLIGKPLHILARKFGLDTYIEDFFQK
jgi:hypothetical protein